MTDYEPYVFLRSELTELTRKGGGGKSKDPWIDVDGTGHRAELLQQLDVGRQLLSSLSGEVSSAVGIPLQLSLRREALAKSNRPSKFLASVGVAPAAALGAGQLVMCVRDSELDALQVAIETGDSKSDLYAISTIENFSVFRPLEDAFQLSSTGQLEELVTDAHSEGRLLRLDLFPWVRPETQWSRGVTLLDHLQDIGLTVRGTRGSDASRSIYVAATLDVNLVELQGLYGLRNAGQEPRYSPWRTVEAQGIAVLGDLSDDLRDILGAMTPSTVVGVLDSGIQSAALEPWVQAREIYDLGNDADPAHGTFVAGLVLAAATLNEGHECFGVDSAAVVDAQVLPAAPIGELVLLDRITEVVEKYPNVKIWNCSFANPGELAPPQYSFFAAEMDALAARLGVLFVQAAGNYGEAPARTWPPSTPLADGIASPADAVNSLVVGSLSHRGGRTPKGLPASYSRRGPGFGGQTKPDVTCWSGDLGPSGELPHSGIRSVVPGDRLAESVGTSFSTPQVSAIAANVWDEVAGAAGVQPTPVLIRGLMVHGASLERHELTDSHRQYVGAGVPPSGLRVVFEAKHSFTTVHEVTVRSKVNWLRAPFPIPASLRTPSGKFRGQIQMTLAYEPIIDRAYGVEAVRTSLEASFGVIDRSGSNVKIKGKAPEEGVGGPYPWEEDLVASGKWSPVRTYFAEYPQGCIGEEWGMRVALTEREDAEDGVEQKAYVILTLRAFDDSLPVHADGLAEIRKLALWSTPLTQHNTLTISV